MEERSGELFYALQRAASSTHKRIDQMLFERLGIGVAQLRILHVVQTSEQISQRALATALGQTEASISRQMKILITKGLVETRVNSANQRERLACITPKGQRLTQAADADVDRAMQQFLQTLPQKQQKQLFNFLAAFQG